MGQESASPELRAQASAEQAARRNDAAEAAEAAAAAQVAGVPGPPPKNIVICLDGTCDELGVSAPTNPAKVFQMLNLDDPTLQVAYYDPGVGTLPSPTARGIVSQAASRLGQMAFGWGMKANLMQAYSWLMDTYQRDDRVYIFGFSRGAYTARALVGLLATPGLLRSGSANLVEYAVNQYARKRRMRLGKPMMGGIAEFADALCWGTRARPMNKVWPYPDDGVGRLHAIPVQYLGVWDTVEASGLLRIGELHWPNTRTLPNVRQLRHAVSIDENRRPYREFLVEPRDGFEEAWFSGVHCDVGGTLKDHELATVALKWVFDGVRSQLLLRDRDPVAAYERFCRVTRKFATGKINKNDWAWNLLIPRRRHIPDKAVLHETVRIRRECCPPYLADLPNADLPSRWTDPDWLKPF
ncbi:MAG TPA: DUF2235 domain-containing protein [Streptosporangiaceae bacterium]|jgi:uncharacterized protein (DUF2235 family)